MVKRKTFVYGSKIFIAEGSAATKAYKIEQTSEL